MGDVGPKALTRAEAAAALGVTPNRVGQLLDDGLLEGPPKPTTGRRRRNGPCVWEWSVKDRLARSQGQQPPPPSRGTAASASLEKRLARLEGGQDELRAQVRGLRELLEGRTGQDSARDALAYVKAAADVARDQASNERRERSRLARLLRDTAASLADELERDDSAQIATLYSDALTQLIAPSDPT